MRAPTPSGPAPWHIGVERFGSIKTGVLAVTAPTRRGPVVPPTLADVAELAGVSRQTVSNALNNPDLLRADTLDRVQAAIDGARLLAQPCGPQPAHPRLAT